jgi:hypothetical protein
MLTDVGDEGKISRSTVPAGSDFRRTTAALQWTYGDGRGLLGLGFTSRSSLWPRPHSPAIPCTESTTTSSDTRLGFKLTRRRCCAREGEVKRGGSGVRARRSSRPAFYRHRPLGLRGVHAEGGGAASREGHCFLWPMGFSWPGWAGAGWVGPTGSAQSESIRFLCFRNIFSANKFQKNTRKCFKARKILRKSQNFQENSQRDIGT